MSERESTRHSDVFLGVLCDLRGRLPLPRITVGPHRPPTLRVALNWLVGLDRLLPETPPISISCRLSCSERSSSCDQVSMAHDARI